MDRPATTAVLRVGRRFWTDIGPLAVCQAPKPASAPKNAVTEVCPARAERARVGGPGRAGSRGSRWLALGDRGARGGRGAGSRGAVGAPGRAGADAGKQVAGLIARYVANARLAVWMMWRSATRFAGSGSGATSVRSMSPRMPGCPRRPTRSSSVDMWIRRQCAGSEKQPWPSKRGLNSSFDGGAEISIA